MAQTAVIKGIKIDFPSRTIIMNLKFAKEAVIPNTP